MAEKRTIDINIKNNADQATKDFNTFNDALDETAKSAKNVNSTFEEVYGELQPLTTRLGEAEDRLYELALAGDTTSKEYQELLTKVGEYRKVQIETDLAVDGAAQTMTQKLGSALNGATSGFAATQGAMALFGGENERLEKSLLKVQSALAIQQGVKGLSDAYKELSIGTKLASAAQAIFSTVVGTTSGALKVFRIALLSTGIGAIVVGIGLLIANFDKLMKPFTKVIDAFKALGDAIGLTNFATDEYIETSKKQEQASVARRNAIDKEIEALDRQMERERNLTSVKLRQIALDQAQAESTEEAIELEKQATAEKIKLNDEEYANFIEKQQETLEAHKEEAKILQGIIDRNIARGRSDHKSELAQLEARKKHIIKLNNDILHNNFDFYHENQVAREEIELQGQKAIDDIRKEELNRYREYARQRLNIARQIEDLENSLLEEGIEKELEINRDKFRRLREDANKNTELTRTERRRLNDLYTEQELQSEQKIREKYEEIRRKEYETEKSEKLELLNFVDETNKAEVEKEKAKNLAILDNAVETNKKIIESDKAVAQAKKDIQDAQIANVEAGIALFKDLAGENNKLQALAIAAENAVGIAKIIISTQAANAAAKLKYAAIPGGLALAAAEITANKISAGIGIAASIAAAAKGIASLKQSAPLDSGGDLGGDSGAGGGEVISPEFNVVGDSSVNQLAQLQQTPTQAFVVSGEVTSAQALDRNRVTNATL